MVCNAPCLNSYYGANPFYKSYMDYTSLSDLYGYDCYGMNSGMLNTPYMPMSTGNCNGYDYSSYYNNMTNYLDFTSNYQLKNMGINRNLELSMNAPYERISSAAAVLNEKICGSEQEQILGALENLKESIRAIYPNASEADIAARANTIYTQQYQTSIVNDIRDKGSDSFWQGFKQCATCGLADKKTAEENISDITGQPVSRTEKAKKVLGNAAGGAAVGAAIGVWFGGVGAAIGAGIGAVVGGIAGAFMKKNG